MMKTIKGVWGVLFLASQFFSFGSGLVFAAVAASFGVIKPFSLGVNAICVSVVLILIPFVYFKEALIKADETEEVQIADLEAQLAETRAKLAEEQKQIAALKEQLAAKEEATPTQKALPNAARWKASVDAGCRATAQAIESGQLWRKRTKTKDGFLDLMGQLYEGDGLPHSEAEEAAWAALPDKYKHGAGSPRATMETMDSLK